MVVVVEEEEEEGKGWGGFYKVGSRGTENDAKRVDRR